MQNTQAQTPCIQDTFAFQALGTRKVQADFTGGYLSSDGGSLLLRQIDSNTALTRDLAKCFTDHRFQPLIEHSLHQLVAQRVHAIALGYEDVNDHDALRLDPLLALTSEREDLLGEDRHHADDKGKGLAGKSTINRLELGANGQSKTKKIIPNMERIRDLLIDSGVKAIPRKSRVITLDFDATDDPVHGAQEGRFFHGYYGSYCYMPPYAFCGDLPLWAELREANIDGCKGTLEAMQLIIPKIRARFGKKVAILIRADSGFCRDDILSWIEEQPHVHYIIGLAKNPTLSGLLQESYDKLLTDVLGEEKYAKVLAELEGKKLAFKDFPAPPDANQRVYADLRYRTQKSWIRERRVIGKAALTNGKINSRFIVTDLTGDEDFIGGNADYLSARSLYEKIYCARGDMENRIKEQQLDMFADRTSTGKLASNQLRLYLSTFAYLLVSRLRSDALGGTILERATVGQIRLKLFKIAAQLTVSVRRIHIRLCSACPMAQVFGHAHSRLMAASG